MNFYGSELWYNIRDNNDKLAISVMPTSIKSFSRLLEENDILYAMYDIPKIIKNAVCFDSQISESKKKSPNSLFMHRMYAVFKHNGENYLANLAIDESYATDKEGHMLGTSQRLYNLKSIKITPVSDSGFQSRGLSHIGDSELTDVDIITIPQLYNIVKDNDKKFYENEHSPGRAEREAEIAAQQDFEQSVKKLDEHNANVGRESSTSVPMEQKSESEKTKTTSVEANRVFDPAVPDKTVGEDTSTDVDNVTIPQSYAHVKGHTENFNENEQLYGSIPQEQKSDNTETKITPTELGLDTHDLMPNDISSVPIGVINTIIIPHSTDYVNDSVDAFFHYPDSERIDEIYYNPDGNDGNGQYVTVSFGYDLVADADAHSNTPDEFFDYLNMHGETILDDRGTGGFSGVEKLLAEETPLFRECTEETMDGLIAIANEHLSKDQEKTVVSAMDEYLNDENNLPEILRGNYSTDEIPDLAHALGIRKLPLYEKKEVGTRAQVAMNEFSVIRYSVSTPM